MSCGGTRTKRYRVLVRAEPGPGRKAEGSGERGKEPKAATHAAEAVVPDAEAAAQAAAQAPPETAAVA